MNEFLYVLDYCQSGIYKIKLDEEDERNDDTERILYKYGLNIDNCSWMFSEKDLELEEIN